jgi:hypothetical protein
MAELGAESDSKGEYLRLCGVIAPLMPPIPGRRKKSSLRPAHMYAVMNALNSIIKHSHEGVTWTFSDGSLIPSTSWSMPDLKQRILNAQHWAWPEPQLVGTIEKFVAGGFLSFDETSQKYSIAPALVEWLLNHAKHIYQMMVGAAAPQSWHAGERGDWLDFNELAFGYLYDKMGRNWRDLRYAMNKEIGLHVPKAKPKKSDRDYLNDYIGERPGYWVVIFTVGFLEPISQWSISERANELKISLYAVNNKDVANAVEQLCEYRVLTRDDGSDIVRISPLFSQWMKDVIAAVTEYMPKFRIDCETWSSHLNQSEPRSP